MIPIHQKRILNNQKHMENVLLGIDTLPTDL